MSGKRGGHGAHGHDEGEHGDHAEESEGGEQDNASQTEDAEEDSENKEPAKGDEEGADSDSSDSEGDESKTPDAPADKGTDSEAHETDSGSNVEGVQFKGATKGGDREGEQGDTRKHIPDAKGGSKKRIESHYGGKQGEATSEEQDASNEDMVSLHHGPFVASILIN